MANKNLLKEAIAEAKSIRETAIHNAKEALEESLTPHLKDMLAAKLQEMEDSDDDEEITEEDIAEEDEEITEVDSEESEDDVDLDDTEAGEDVPGEDDIEEPEEEMDIQDMEIEDLKALIRSVVSQEIGDAGEEIPGEEGPEDMTGMDDMGDGEEEEDIIDLDELLKSLEEEEQVEEGEEEVEEGHAVDTPVQDAPRQTDVKHSGDKEKERALQEAYKVIKSLKGDLKEVNLLNAKLLYLNKILKSNSLTEAQKVNIISSFDKSETVKEVKLVYETTVETLKSMKPKKTVKEHATGSSSKVIGGKTSKPGTIVEADETVKRLQKLAGII